MPGQIRNSTGHEILVKMGVNSLRLHCIPPWWNWVSSLWIYSQFEQYFMPSRIGSKSIEFQPNLSSISCPVKLGVNP